METQPKIYNGGLAVDDRGVVSFVNDFNFEGVKRSYMVENHEIGFIRAWHGHKNEGKYVSVVNGSAIVGAISITQPNFEYKDPQRYVLSSKKPQILWIPPGFANGFKSLEENTKIIFYSTSTLEESLNDDIRFPHDKWDIWNIEYR